MSNSSFVSVEEEANQQNSATVEDVQLQLQNTEVSAEATITLRRSTLTAFITTIIVIVLILFGGVVITASKLVEMKHLLNPGLTETQKEFPSLSRKEGVVPDEVWRWIVAAKADMVLNPKSAHALLKVSKDGRRICQASPSSPPRVLTAQTYLRCICVSSEVLPNTRAYFEAQVTQTVSWTLGFRTASFSADNNHHFSPDEGIWTIASADGKIVINDGKAILTQYVTPTKLGLYLDYKRGQLSFYDAVAKYHLYTYLTNFKEKLLFYANVDVRKEETQEAFITFS